MPLSFNLTEFSQRYGIYCFPILADLAAYSLLSRATTAAHAQIVSLVGGLATGIGLAYVFQVSLITGLIGAGLYLAYKTAFYFLSRIQREESSPLDVKKAVDDLEKAYDKFQEQFQRLHPMTIDGPPQLNPNLQDFLRKDPIIQHIKKTKIGMRAQIEENTLSILNQCEAILFQIHGILEEKTKELEGDHPTRLLKMGELLKKRSFNPDHAFGKALVILYRSYCSFERNGYTLHLPYLQNAEQNKTHFLILGEPMGQNHEGISQTLKRIEKLQGLIAILTRDRSEHDDAKLIQNFITGTSSYMFLTPPVSVAAEQLGF